MAYAQLVFSSVPQAGYVLKAIAKVLLGEKNISNLEGVINSSNDLNNLGCGVYKSEILNENNENWSLAYPAAIPAQGNNVLNTFTVSSPCLNGVQKYVRFIIASSAGAYTEPLNGTSTLYSSTTSYCIYAQGLSSINSSTGAATNLTWRNSAGTAATIKKGSSTLEPFVVWISWSARHLFVISNVCGGPGRTFFHGTFEFDITGPVSYSNSAPCVHITGSGGDEALANLTTNSIATTTKVISLLNTYDVSTSAVVPIRCIVNSNGTTARFFSPSVTGITPFDSSSKFQSAEYSNSIKKFKSVPLLVNDTLNGNGILDLTKHSNIRLFSNHDIENSIWDIDGVKYKSLNIYSAALNGTLFSTVLVKYG